jgi:hypothetical protein
MKMAKIIKTFSDGNIVEFDSGKFDTMQAKRILKF